MLLLAKKSNVTNLELHIQIFMHVKRSLYSSFMLKEFFSSIKQISEAREKKLHRVTNKLITHHVFMV